MAHAHPYCLAEWVTARGALSCEVCGFAYTFEVAVEEAPPLRSAAGLRLALRLVVSRLPRRVTAALAPVFARVGPRFLLPLICAQAWLKAEQRAAAAGPRGASAYEPLRALCCVGILCSGVAPVLLLAHREFTAWASLHEDDVSGTLPAEPPAQPSMPTAADAVEAAALNAAFTRRGPLVAEEKGERYIALAEAPISAAAALRMLRDKVRAVPGRTEKLRWWAREPARFAAAVLAVQAIGMIALVLGHATLRIAAALFELALARACPSLSRQTAAAGSLLCFPPFLHWFVVWVIGLLEWCALSARLSRSDALSVAPHARALALWSTFGRGVVASVALPLTWLAVIPIVVYACLCPFLAEGDAAAFMAPHEGWRTLHAERLLPLACTAPAQGLDAQLHSAPVLQPLNVARALVAVLPDVWRGRGPPLFDTATCGAGQVFPSADAPLVAFALYSAAVASRLATASTWLTLFAPLRLTLTWLLAGALAVIGPYTSFARDCVARGFFFAFFRLASCGLCRTLIEVPLLVALYTVVVGFAVFYVLHHASPGAFPLTMTQLAFATTPLVVMELCAFYTWGYSLLLVQRWLQAVLRRCFLPASGESGSLGDASLVVERCAYAVCLFCASVAVGAAMESVSRDAPAALLTHALMSLVQTLRLCTLNGGQLRDVRARAQDLVDKAVLRLFYGTHVEFLGAHLCICHRVSAVPGGGTTAGLQPWVVQQDSAVLYLMWRALTDSSSIPHGVYPREAVQRLTTQTLRHYMSASRTVWVVLLVVEVPLVLCWLLHINEVISALISYTWMPLWVHLAVRWLVGALALLAWTVAEGRLLRTQLSRRCIEHGFLLLHRPLSLPVFHAVLLPLTVHGGAARLSVLLLRHFTPAALAAVTAQRLLIVFALLLAFLEAPRRIVQEALRPRRRVQAVAPQGAAVGQEDAPQLHQQERQAPAPTSPYVRSSLRERMHGWIAASSPVDVVLVSRPRATET